MYDLLCKRGLVMKRCVFCIVLSLVLVACGVEQKGSDLGYEVIEESHSVSGSAVSGGSTSGVDNPIIRRNMDIDSDGRTLRTAYRDENGLNRILTYTIYEDYYFSKEEVLDNKDAVFITDEVGSKIGLLEFTTDSFSMPEYKDMSITTNYIEASGVLSKQGGDYPVVEFIDTYANSKFKETGLHMVFSFKTESEFKSFFYKLGFISSQYELTETYLNYQKIAMFKMNNEKIVTLTLSDDSKYNFYYTKETVNNRAVDNLVVLNDKGVVGTIAYGGEFIDKQDMSAFKFKSSSGQNWVGSMFKSDDYFCYEVGRISKGKKNLLDGCLIFLMNTKKSFKPLVEVIDVKIK